MILYKYFPPARADVLNRKRIRFTPPGAFNDPFEFRPVLKSLGSDEYVQDWVDREFDKIVDEELKKVGPLLSRAPPKLIAEFRAKSRAQMLPAFRIIEEQLIPRLKQEFDARFNQHFGVLCLSERWDSILMWGHYSQSHEGFAVGFDAEHPFFNQGRSDKDEFGFLRRVRYQEKRPVVSVADSDALEWFETKANVWSYEHEWRMFLVLSSATEVTKIGTMEIYLFSFPLECIKEIAFGSRCSKETQEVVRGAFAGCSSQPDFFQCGLDDTDFKIVRHTPTPP